MNHLNTYPKRAPKGINQLVYDVLNVLWVRDGYTSNFTIHTMGWK